MQNLQVELTIKQTLNWVAHLLLLLGAWIKKNPNFDSWTNSKLYDMLLKIDKTVIVKKCMQQNPNIQEKKKCMQQNANKSRRMTQENDESTKDTNSIYVYIFSWSTRLTFTIGLISIFVSFLQI